MQRKPEGKKFKVRSISIDPDVAEKMEQFQDVNWSRVAQAAFVHFMKESKDAQTPASIEGRLDYLESILGIRKTKEE